MSRKVSRNRTYKTFEKKSRLDIDHDNKLIYIHIPKTGGKSTREALFGGMKRGTGHASIRAYKNIDLSKYYKFSVVRNPYDRIRSLYRFTHQYLKPGWWNEQILECKTFDDFCNNLHNVYKKKDHPGILPQTFWITDKCGAILVDELFLFDDIQASINGVLERFGIDKRIKHLNKSSNHMDDSSISERNKSLIRAVYSCDIALYEMVKREPNGVWRKNNMCL